MCNTAALRRFTGFYNHNGELRVNALTEALSLELLLAIMAVTGLFILTLEFPALRLWWRCDWLDVKGTAAVVDCFALVIRMFMALFFQTLKFTAIFFYIDF